MRYIDTDYYLDSKNREIGERLAWNIGMQFKGYGEMAPEKLCALLYVMYCLKIEGASEVSRMAIKRLPLDDEIRLPLNSLIRELDYDRLTEALQKYDATDFAMACLVGVDNNDYRHEATPVSIIKLANGILGIKPSDKVADICCGTGNYLVETALSCKAESYTGYEISQGNSIVTLIKSKLIDADIKVKTCDIFKYQDDGAKFDALFANYPFGMRTRGSYVMDLFKDRPDMSARDLSRVASYDWLFNWKICELLAPNGKAVAIMTNGSTWNRLDAPMRKYCVEKGLIESVISLPPRMFRGTGLSTTMIVFSYGNESVKFVDASNVFVPGRRQNEFSDDNIATIVNALNDHTDISRELSLDEIRKNDYALSLSRYQTSQVNIENGVVFEEVIKDITRGASWRATELDAISSLKPTNYQYLSISNIRDGIVEKNLPYLKELTEKDKRYCVYNNNMIFSKIGRPYKIAVAEVEEGKFVLANGNLYVIHLDLDRVNPYYLKAYFESYQGTEALNSVSVGAAMPTIGISSLRKLVIPLPNMDEQNRIANEYLTILDEIKVLSSKLEAATAQLGNVFPKEEGGD